MEAPLSRVEAILQNILGADNVLVPPQSRVEEILLAILNNTEYIHPGDPSRVEEILLAIKDGGSYDKKALSRVEDILIHKLNDEEYTDYSEDDLSRVEKLLIQWIDLHPEVIKELTTSSFPISILANGLPLLDYTIYGNTTQPGTPTPDNPIMPEGTGERTGNVIDYTQSESGGIDGNGNNVTASNLWRSTVFIPIDSLQCFISWTEVTSFIAARINYYTSEKSHISREQITTTGTALTIPQNAAYFKWTLYVTVGTVINLSYVADLHIMLNSGSQPLPYEPYGYKIPISSASTTTPVYLGEVETTRKIKKLVLTGNETYVKDGNATYLYYIYVSHMYHTNCLCSHLKSTTGYPITQEGCSTYNNTSIIYLNFGSTVMDAQTSGNTVTGLKEYLAAQYAAGTPVTVWYVLAEPETGIVNEPLMKIGEYADTVSMEQAGVQIPTLKKPNTTVIDVETSLEPSSMYLKYSEPSDGPTPKTPVLGTKDREIYVTPNNEVYVLRR